MYVIAKLLSHQSTDELSHENKWEAILNQIPNGDKLLQKVSTFYAISPCVSVFVYLKHCKKYYIDSMAIKNKNNLQFINRASVFRKAKSMCIFYNTEGTKQSWKILYAYI